jgi:tripartite-type tricarboxylate transporter receptor subunit TctC
MKAWRFLIVGMAAVGFIFSVQGEGLGAEKKFPTKAIQVIIPFQPGDTDNLLRPFVEKMPEFLGQPVTMVYKPGAAGGVGAGFVATSKPDGYMLVGTSQSSILIVPLTSKDLNYTWESFAPVSCLVEGTFLFAVKSDARWKNLKDLVEDAKKNPDKITFTSSGTYGITHIAGEAFCKEAGVKMSYIPSQGSGPAVTATLGGHIDIASTALAPALPHLKAGTMRSIAVFNEKRVRVLPDSPSFTEMGYRVIIPGNYGLLAPKGTPKDVVETLHQALKKAANQHKGFIEDRLEKLGAQIGFMGPEEYTEFLRGQYTYFDKVLKGIKK